MLFGRNERKKGHPMLAVAVGALAVVGAMSVITCGKQWVCDKGRRMAGFVKGMVGSECDCEYGE